MSVGLRTMPKELGMLRSFGRRSSSRGQGENEDEPAAGIVAGKAGSKKVFSMEAQKTMCEDDLIDYEDIEDDDDTVMH